MCRLGPAPQAIAAKQLARVRSRLQEDIEDGETMENGTLEKIAAAFSRDIKSKDKLETYDRNVKFYISNFNFTSWEPV